MVWQRLLLLLIALGDFGGKAEDPSYDLAFLVFFFLALALDACLYFGPLFAAASTARPKRVHASACNSMSAGLIRLSSGFFMWCAQSKSHRSGCSSIPLIGHRR
jgi:zinc transporter ZupT